MEFIAEPTAKKLKMATADESMVSSPSVGLHLLAGTLLDLVVESLDTKSMGRLCCVCKHLKDELETSIYWFSCTCKILENEEDGEGKAALAGLSWADASSVDWKGIASFYYSRSMRPSRLLERLNNYVFMLSGRMAKTCVQCSGTMRITPDLYVPAAGMRLSFPLEPSSLRALIDGNYCEQAPVGRGPETVVDKGIRNGWRLMLGKDVFVGNKEWNAEMTCAGVDIEGVLHNVQEKLVPQLKMKGDVLAQPYSMLIYEEGNFFKPHRDTLRGPHHFGTMIVTLPVKGGSEGGAFVLTHTSASSETSREVAQFEPPHASEGCKYCAFYTDVFHEVKPITSGYRVALTYHLWALPNKTQRDTIKPEAIPRPIAVSANETITWMLTRVLKHTLEANLNDYCNHRYVWALDHSYGSHHLSYTSLRGRDAIHYNLFKDLDMEGVSVVLETLCVETFDKPKDITKYQTMDLVEVNESKKSTRRASQNTIWLNQERFLSMDHEFAEYEYYTGNEGYATGMQYKHACIELRSDGFETESDY